MIKPPKIFLYYIVVFIVFGIFSYYIPEKGISIGSSPYKIRWISLKSLLKKGEQLDSLENAFELLKDSIFLPRQDSLNIQEDGAELVVVRDSLPQVSITAKKVLVYPESFKTLLFSFYNKISFAADSSKVVRVLHMGDSQIEGDRITKFLRESFQQKFKGTGPGLVNVYDPQKQFPSVWIRNEGYWSDHPVYKVPRKIKDNQFGLLGRVSTIDSLGVSTIFIARSTLAQSKATNFYKSRLFLKCIDKPILVNALWEGEKISSDSLKKEEGITEINWTFHKAPKKFSIQFKSDRSPLFLGLSLDSLGGVAVDNIAMRGQSSPRLDKTDTLLFKTMASYMDIGMVILQFGTNMVPTITDNYKFYSYTFYKQLQIIKQTMPGIPVVVVGVGDVGNREEGKVKSYKHIYKIKEAQKAAAFKAGYGFFDLFEAMGGEGSMLKWVEEEPKLAMSDYTHFNKIGGEKVADWIYNAIMSDYNNWNKTTIFNNESSH